MKRFLIFAGLLAVQIVLSAGALYNPKIILTNEKDVLQFNAQSYHENLTNCKLETNEQKVYSIFPDNELPLGIYNGGIYRICAFEIIPSLFKYAGRWIMTTTTDKGEYKDEFEVIVETEVNTVPTNEVYGYADQWIYVALDTNETDVTACNLTMSQNSLEYNLMTDKIEGMNLWGNCGVRMLVNSSLAGKWEIRSWVGKYLTHHGEFRIAKTFQNAEESDEVVTRTWPLGEKNMGYDWQDHSILFCSFEKPDGTKLPPTFGKCSMHVDVVSAYHEGTWRASYAVQGKVELQHRDVVIKTKDENFLECSYSAGVGEEINLLCRTGVNTLKFCSFVRPDQYVINMPVGVGNENYTYYGEGFENKNSGREYAECGVTIRKPSAIDFGLWTCEMGMAEGVRGTHVVGSVIEVSRTRAGPIDSGSTIVNPTVYVKRGDSFKISCKGISKLKYCWLSSPNGTAYSISEEGSSGKSFKYVGKGFTMGECGASVPTSNDTDSGKWICHLGYAGGLEDEQIVPVKVTDSYLIASDDTVHVAKSTSLTCRTFMGEDGTVKYCRWVRPNGHGINKLDASRYRLTQEIDRCGLTILDFQPEDAGKWTCLAALTRFKDREEHATIELKSATNVKIYLTQISSLLMIILGSGLLIFTLIGASYAAFFVFRKRSSPMIKNPPPYYPTDYPIPDEIRTDDSPDPNKDTRF